MKPIYALILILTLGFGFENSSHAFFACQNSRGSEFNYCPDAKWFVLTTSSTLGPFALIGDGSFELSNPATRDLLVTQAEQVLNGQGDAINQSENLVHALAQANNVSDEALAHAVESLEASGSEISQETIKKALK